MLWELVLFVKIGSYISKKDNSFDFKLLYFIDIMIRVYVTCDQCKRITMTVINQASDRYWPVQFVHYPNSARLKSSHFD